MSFELTRIASKFNKGQFKMFLTGYENGERVTKYDMFQDYFYYDSEHISDVENKSGFTVDKATELKTIDDKKAYKVNYTSIVAKKRFIRKHADYSYEADVSPEFKYVQDKQLNWSSKRNICFFDIETWFDPDNPQANKPDNAQMPITSMVAYAVDTEKYFVFSWHPEHTKNDEKPRREDKDNVSYIYLKDEETMIEAFLYYVKKNNIDVLTGWYSSQFDLPYIINRCKNLDIDYTKLSPVGYIKMYKKQDYWKLTVNGLDCIDLMDSMQDLGFKLTNWKLDTAAKEVVGTVEKMTEFTWKDWLENYEGFLQYNIQDVEILLEIEKKLNIFSLYCIIQEIAGLEAFKLIFFKSMLVDYYILKAFHGKMVFPTQQVKQRQSFAGAIVLDPLEPGGHKDVATLDYTSLYPTSIMAFNISPDTFICSEANALEETGMTIDQIASELTKRKIDFIDTGHDESLFGKRYLFFGHSHKLGIMPYLLKTLFLMRKDINARLAAGEIPEQDRVANERKQRAIKLILNSAYGAMGFNYFRMYKPECADATTYFGRQALLYAVDKMSNDYDMPVLYGDTDSTFVKQNGKSVPEIIDLLEGDFTHKLRHDFVKKYATDIDDEYFFLDLKFEKDLEHVYFGNAKKRYYGIERKSGKRYIRGLNIIRKDAPTYCKKILDTLAEKAVRGQLTSSDLVDIRKGLSKVPLSQIGIVKSFSKRFEEYVKSKPQHLTACQWANEIFNLNIDNMDKPLLFYAKALQEDHLKPKKRHRAICVLDDQLDLLEKENEYFELDYDTFFKKQIYEQLEEFNEIDYIKTVLEEYNEASKTLNI